jgi:hypothetical protein
MKSGVCPKCGSARVHTDARLTKYSARFVPITIWSIAGRDCYACADCGYLEYYITTRKALDKIARKWPAVEPQQRA